MAITMQSRVRRISARAQAQRDFLIKQRELAVGKGFHQFKRAANLDSGYVDYFFKSCPELDMIQEGDIVRLSIKKTPAS